MPNVKIEASTKYIQPLFQFLVFQNHCHYAMLQPNTQAVKKCPPSVYHFTVEIRFYHLLYF